MSKDWCTIESDPGVFTELMEKIGVKGVQVADILSLDIDTVNRVKPIYGLIFLFKWVGKNKELIKPLPYVPTGLFFAKQMVTNACATQAILSVLMNIEKGHQGFELGEVLKNIKSFATGLPPSQIGEAIGTSQEIKEAHNSFARPEPFVMEKSYSKDGDAFHFISYVPYKSKCFELDGLNNGPVEVGVEKEGVSWKKIALEHMRRRINEYTVNEIQFNILAIVHNREQIIKEKIKELEEKIVKEKPVEIEEKKIKFEIGQLQQDLVFDLEKKIKWKNENMRRRHNYVPFLLNILKILAKKKVLLGLVDNAKKKKIEKIEMEKERKKLEREKKKKEKEEKKKTAETEKKKEIKEEKK